MDKVAMTGDKLISKVSSMKYRDNYDRIFGKEKNGGSIGGKEGSSAEKSRNNEK
jgi:hypothetical protein